MHIPPLKRLFSRPGDLLNEPRIRKLHRPSREGEIVRNTQLHAIRPTLVADALQFYQRYSRYKMIQEFCGGTPLWGNVLFRWSIVPIRDGTANEETFQLVIGGSKRGSHMVIG
jgi:hypothetical protein